MSTTEAAPDPRWRRLPDERPTQLIDAALETFSEHGFSAAKLEDIAHRAGVSKGTIYLYFPSKEELFKAVVRHTIGQQLTDAESASPPGSASDELERTLRRRWALTAQPRFDRWYRILMSELPRHPELLEFYNREVIDRNWAMLQQVIERGVRSGEFRPIHPRRAVGLVNALVVMHRQWISSGSIRPEYQQADRGELIDTIVDFALAALRNPAFTGPTS
ncbi:MAG TPA: TetR/AcrR family transcriptional regulator [Gemmatimonadaceae bacterium]|jgi:AcrR family transcriptional regulator